MHVGRHIPLADARDIGGNITRWIYALPRYVRFHVDFVSGSEIAGWLGYTTDPIKMECYWIDARTEVAITTPLGADPQYRLETGYQWFSSIQRWGSRSRMYKNDVLIGTGDQWSTSSGPLQPMPIGVQSNGTIPTSLFNLLTGTLTLCNWSDLSAAQVAESRHPAPLMYR